MPISLGSEAGIRGEWPLIFAFYSPILGREKRRVKGVATQIVIGCR